MIKLIYHVIVQVQIMVAIVLLVACSGVADVRVKLPPLTIEGRLSTSTGEACQDEEILLMLPDFYGLDVALEAALRNSPSDNRSYYDWSRVRTDTKGVFGHDFSARTKSMGYPISISSRSPSESTLTGLDVLIRLHDDEVYLISVRDSTATVYVIDSNGSGRRELMGKTDKGISISAKAERKPNHDMIDLVIIKYN